MRALFSEFSYGFALANELVEAHRHLLRGAPRLPSQREEGRATDGGGYDIALPFRGFPLFIQFKISEYMVRSTAAEWDHFGEKYFRFQLHPLRHSRQHHMLIDLEETGNFVYYAAPAFYKAEDLNEAFGSRAVVDHTIFVRPSDIGRLPDPEDHCIAFRRDGQFAYLFSKVRREVPIAARGESIGPELDLRRRRAGRAPVLDEQYFTQLASRMMTLVLDQVDFEGIPPTEIARGFAPRQRVEYLTRTFFGAELLWVQQANLGG